MLNVFALLHNREVLGGARKNMGEKTASQMGKAAKNKGKTGEREVVRILREHGFPEARRTQQFSGKEGTADVEGIEGVHIEVKRQEKLEVEKWHRQACEDARDGEIPIVAFRRSGQPWRVVMNLEDFLDGFFY